MSIFHRSSPPPRALHLAGRAKTAFERKAGPKAAELFDLAMEAGYGRDRREAVNLRREYNALAANQTWAALNADKPDPLTIEALRRYVRASNGFAPNAPHKLNFSQKDFSRAWNQLPRERGRRWGMPKFNCPPAHRDRRHGGWLTKAELLQIPSSQDLLALYDKSGAHPNDVHGWTELEAGRPLAPPPQPLRWWSFYCG